MALVPYLTKDNMNEGNRAYAEEFEKKHGRPPWLRMLGAHYPPFLDAIDAMYPNFMENGSLDKATKELIFVASAEARGCQWCMQSHSRYLVQELGLTREQVRRARAGEEVGELSDLQTLLIGFARRVATDPRGIKGDDMDALRAAGLSEKEIVEVVAVCCFSAFTNAFSDTLKMADDIEMMGLQEEYF